MSKLKVFFHTDFSCAKTGFGTNARRILSYLYKTNKYDIVHYCCSMRNGNLNLIKTPWKSIGCLPHDEFEYQQMINHEGSPIAKQANYGHFLLEDALKEHKPDVYIGQQDFWAFDGYTKNWWNKIPCVIHTTIDSLPILDIAKKNANKIKNLWVWSEFAEKEFHKLGFNHIKTVHGAIDKDEFYRLTDKQKFNLRNIFNIDQDTFVIGFVFRNQLRKSIPHLLEAFKKFKEITNAKAKLALHTCFTDNADTTWDIPKLINDIGVDNNDILVTHVCNECFRYWLKPFEGEQAPCPICGIKNSMNTSSVHLGVKTDELNEIYNIMDVYCHPFTSGGQEIPIQEAKLAGLPTLVTNYACGEDMCVPEAYSISLDWEKDWEPNTNFIKARTKISSIVDKLIKVYKMSKDQRNFIGNSARQWVIDNYSTEVIGRQFEKFLDNQSKTEYNFDMTKELKNPEAEIIPIKDNRKWLKEMYMNILKMDVSDKDEGLEYWLSSLANGASRESVENYFRKEAYKDNLKIENENNSTSLRDIIGFENDKKLLYVIPESIGDIFIASSLFENLRNKYNEYKIIVATNEKYFSILKGNPYIDKVIPYFSIMDNEIIMTGSGKQKGFVDVYIFGTAPMQRFLNYVTQKD